MTNIKNTESLEKDKKQDINIYSKFIKKFSDEKLSDEKEKINYINQIMSSDVISPDLKRDLENFWWKYEEFDWLDYDKITISKLKRQVWSIFFTLKNKRQELEKSFLNSYDINSKYYDENISRYVSKLNESDLDKITKSDSRRFIFLKKILWDWNIPKKKESLDFLKDFNLSTRIENKLKDNTLNDKRKQELKRLLYTLCEKQKNIEPIDTVDLKELFSCDLFSFEEKKELVYSFINCISIWEAIKLKLVDKNSAKIKKIKESLVRDSWIDWLDEKDISVVWAWLNDDNILVSVKKLFSTDSNIDILSKKLLPSVIDQEIKNWIEKEKKDILKKQPKTPEDFRNKIDMDEKLKWRLKGWENFWNKSFFQIVAKDPKWKKIFLAYKVKQEESNIWEEKWFSFDVFAWQEKIDWTMSYTLFKKNHKNSYSGFIEKFYKWKIIETEIINYDTLEERNKSWKIDISLDDNMETFKSEQELEKQKLNVVKNKKKEILIKEGKIPKDITDEELEENVDYKNLSLEEDDEDIQKQFDEIDSLNINFLKNQIDILDPDWKKFLFDKDTTFETEKNQDWETGYFTIFKVDPNWSILLNSCIWWQEEISFWDFLYNWKEKKAKRTSKINDIDSFIKDTDWKWNNWNLWEKFEVKNWNIVQKDTKAEKNFKYDYLVSNKKNCDELIKIHSISWDKVVISFWNFEEELKESKQGKNKLTHFKVSPSKLTVNIWFLDTWVKKHSLVPKSIEEENEQKKEDIEEVRRKGSFWSGAFNNLSMADVIAWWKLFINSIESFLKEWNEEQAARFANSLWLPKEMKADLLAREENSKKKRMDDYLTRLKGIDSKEAIAMVEWWLLNKNSPEYKKEAWLAFMFEKYWILYTKKALYKYKWKFLWYISLWWKIWDELYNEVKQKAEESDQVFTEESLVKKLLEMQCTSGWYKWIKRRSKLHKEIDQLREKWKEDEFNGWKLQCKNISNSRDKLELVMWEVMGWGYPNAIWWLEAMVEAWGSMEQMNKIPFVFMFSGAAYKMEESSRELLRKMPGKWIILPILSFFRYKSSIDLANNTILAVSKRIEELEPEKYKWISKKAQTIFDNIDSNSISEAYKIQECIKFYDEYWSILIKTLYSLNEGSSSNNSYLNNMIYLEKEKNSVFKNYYDVLKENADWYSYKDDFMADAFNWVWLSWLDSYNTMSFALNVTSSGPFVNGSSWPLIAEVDKEFEFLSRKSNLSVEDRKTLIFKNLTWLLWAIVWKSTASLSRSKQLNTFFDRCWIKTLRELDWFEKEKLVDP